MRIAFFVQYSDLNGTYFRWHNLAKALQLLGHEVDVYAGDHNRQTKPRKEIRDGISYDIIPVFKSARLFYSPNDPFSSLRRLKYLPAKEYEVYHLFQPFLQAYIPWKFLMRKKKNAVFFYDWDDLWTKGLFTKTRGIREKYLASVTRYLEKKIPLIADGVTVCSGFLSEKIKPATPVQKIYNGFWPDQLPDKEEMRKKWNLSPDIFYLGYIGKTAGELDWIIDGLEYLQSNEVTKVKLVICGPPRNYMEKNGYTQNNCIVYLGEIKPWEAREVAAAVDLGMIPLEENLFNESRFPIKFFDFLTVNTPVYLSKVGEIASIGKELSGTFIGPAKKQEWIHQLKKVVEDLQHQERIVNIEGLIERFSWPAITDNLLDFYYLVQKNKKATSNN